MLFYGWKLLVPSSVRIMTSSQNATTKDQTEERGAEGRTLVETEAKALLEVSSQKGSQAVGGYSAFSMSLSTPNDHQDPYYGKQLTKWDSKLWL